MDGHHLSNGVNDKIQSPKLEDITMVGNRASNKQISIEKKYDLEERTAVFGEKVIDFVKTLPNNVIKREVIRQLVKAGTSVGANYPRPVR